MAILSLAQQSYAAITLPDNLPGFDATPYDKLVNENTSVLQDVIQKNQDFANKFETETNIRIAEMQNINSADHMHVHVNEYFKNTQNQLGKIGQHFVGKVEDQQNKYNTEVQALQNDSLSKLQSQFDDTYDKAIQGYNDKLNLEADFTGKGIIRVTAVGLSNPTSHQGYFTHFLTGATAIR